MKKFNYSSDTFLGCIERGYSFVHSVMRHIPLTYDHEQQILFNDDWKISVIAYPSVSKSLVHVIRG